MHFYSIDMLISGFFYLFVNVLNPAQSEQIYQSLIIRSNPGSQYSPINFSAQLISLNIVNSIHQCTLICNQNPLCRVFDYGAVISKECRLFEGDTNTLGTIISSSISDSIVGSIQITPSLFAQYGKSCSSVCSESRYLTCGNNSLCQCMPHTYCNPSAGVCLPQSPVLGASCQQGIKMCREDLHYTCLQFNECGPLSLLSGTTIVNQTTVIEGGSNIGLNGPTGITLYGVGENESLIICDSNNRRLIHVKNVNSYNKTMSLLVRNWTGGNKLDVPYYTYLDTEHGNDLYVGDSYNYRVMLFSSMQITNPLPKVVAGITGFVGSTLNKFNGAIGVTVDKQKNVYISDYFNYRIVRWAPNATSGVLIAGTGIPASDAMSLGGPQEIILNDNDSVLYAADTPNHRIQVYSLNGTPPYRGVSVAGENGAGTGNHQLNWPTGIWISKKTKRMYITDQMNHRIQRWNYGASSGVTLVGDPNGNSGSDSTKFNQPYGIAISEDETRMYVCDYANNRIQRFDLI